MSKQSPETEVWDWRDNLENVDTDFPLGFSQALWDELTQNDLDSRLLFATPMTDTLISDPALDALGSQESSVQGTYNVDSHGGSPRPKRRRLFKATVQSPSNSDAAFQEMHAPFKSDVNCLLPESEEQENSISIPSVWYKDENQSSPGDNLEPMAESWMITCIEDNDSNSSASHMETTVLVTETPELWTPKGQPCKDPVLQGPATPFSSRPSTPGNRVSAVRKLNMSTPVVYPFTMVKPLGTEGDVTLTDINQLIATPPKALLHQGQVSTDVRPSSKLESGVGLSGKSVVARTRICTEGCMRRKHAEGGYTFLKETLCIERVTLSLNSLLYSSPHHPLTCKHAHFPALVFTGVNAKWAQSFYSLLLNTTEACLEMQRRLMWVSADFCWLATVCVCVVVYYWPWEFSKDGQGGRSGFWSPV